MARLTPGRSTPDDWESIVSTAEAPDSQASEPDSPAREELPLRAVHTLNLPAHLRELGASLLVTTYQAGKLVLVRDEGDHLNAHFRSFQALMGLALDGDRLAVGSRQHPLLLPLYARPLGQLQASLAAAVRLRAGAVRRQITSPKSTSITTPPLALFLRQPAPVRHDAQVNQQPSLPQEILR